MLSVRRLMGSGHQAYGYMAAVSSGMHVRVGRALTGMWPPLVGEVALFVGARNHTLKSIYYDAIFIKNSQIKGPGLPVPMSRQTRFRASLNL